MGHIGDVQMHHEHLPVAQTVPNPEPMPIPQPEPMPAPVPGPGPTTAFPPPAGD